MRYAPPPSEIAYYQGLFHQADVTQNQSLNGRDAVTFLHRSKLSIEILKHIWTLADQPKTNALDKAKFFTSVRLIQLFQNGQSAAIHGGNASLAVGEGVVLRPPFFEGVTGVSVHPYALSAPNPALAQQQQQQQQQQQPPQAGSPTPSPSRGRLNSANSQISTTQQQQQQPQQQSSLATQDPYVMPPNEQSRYAALFPQYENDGHVYGAEAVALFSKSGLSKEVLRDIWNIVDNPVDNRLSILEFCIAMHLIVCVSKKNLPMPSVLPPSLKALKDAEERKQAQGSGGMSANPSFDKETPQLTTAGSMNNMNQQPSLQQHQPSLTIQPALSNNAMNSNPNATTIPTPTGTLNVSDAFQGMSPEPKVQIQLTTTAEQPAPAPTILVRNSSNGTAVSGLGVSIVSSPHRITPVYPDPIPENNVSTAIPASGTGTPLVNAGGISVPNINALAGGMPNSGANTSSQEKLESVQGILQKLQAENISLKAQLSHFSEEDQRTREEIHITVSEIAVLSQELTGLRSQVAEAKGKLIEATSELRAQVEKRDILKSMVMDAQQTRDAIDNGVIEVEEAKEASKLHRVAATPANVSRDVFQPNVFDDPTSRSTAGHNPTSSSSNIDGFVDVASAYYGAPPIKPVEDKPPTVSEKDLSELEQCKEDAERARKDYELVKDQSLALTVTYEDLKAQVDRQDILITQKQKSLPKKKGFMRGSNKSAKKEIETAQELAAQLRYDAQGAHDKLMSTEAEANRLQMKALELADKAHEMEMTLTQQASQIEGRPHETETFHEVEHTTTSGTIPPPPPPSYNFSDPYGHPPIPPTHMGTPSGMGYGGNPATPARPIDAKQINASGPSSALGGHLTDGSNYGASSVLTDTSYFGGASAAGSVSVLGYTSDAASYTASQALSVHSEKNVYGGGTMPGYDSGANLYVAESNKSEQDNNIMGGYASGTGSISASKVEQDNTSIMGGYTSGGGSTSASKAEKDNTSIMGGYASGAGSIAVSKSYAGNSIAGGSNFSQEQPSIESDEIVKCDSIVDNKPSDASYGLSYSDGTSVFGSTTGISYTGHIETNSEIVPPKEKSNQPLSSHAEVESADDSMIKANASMASMTMSDRIPSPDKQTLMNPVYQFSGSIDQAASKDSLPNPASVDNDVTASESAGEVYKAEVKSFNSGVGLELPSPTSFDNTHLSEGMDGLGGMPSIQSNSFGIGGNIPSPEHSYDMGSKINQDVGSLMDFGNKNNETSPPESSQQPSTESVGIISSFNQKDPIEANDTFGLQASSDPASTPVMDNFGVDTLLSRNVPTDEPGSPISTNSGGQGLLGTANMDGLSSGNVIAMGTMSQMNSGGIPSPTISMDEYESPFSNMQPEK